jgi:hypothetical protein
MNPPRDAPREQSSSCRTGADRSIDDRLLPRPEKKLKKDV